MGDRIRIDDARGTRDLPWADLVGHPAATEDHHERTRRTGHAVPVAELVDSPEPWTIVTSRGGDYRACIPTEVLRAGGWLLVGSTDAPLSRNDGGPFRLLVADGDTLCWNVKDVGSIVTSPLEVPDSVPENPPH